MNNSNTKSKAVISKDLLASISQSAVDKLLNSAAFPLVLVNTTNPPPGIVITTENADSDEIILTPEAVAKLLHEISSSVNHTRTRIPEPRSDSMFYSEAISNLSETIESAKSYLTARTSAGNTKPPTPFEGPDPAYAQSILDGGIEGLASIKGIEFKLICSKLQVIADNKPNLTVNGPIVSITNSKITTNATAELWWYHPTFHCSAFCTHWSVTWSWDRVASVSASLRVDLDGYVTVVVNGKILYASLHINKLRLDYPLLRDIPLEGIANRVLATKQIPIFDAGNFIASIPIINSRFSIDAIDIPSISGGLEIDIAIKQI
ncbi:MAG TPA: hypothetical protein VGG71_03780 [Chitinophagaceae bacterium]